MRLLAESFPTDVTTERFVSSVDSGVLVQMGLLVEPLTTDVAAEGFLSGVNPHVDLQIGSPGETFPTVTTKILQRSLIFTW